MFGTARSPREVNAARACAGTHSAHFSRSSGQILARNIILPPVQRTATTWLLSTTRPRVPAEGRGGATEPANCSCFPRKMRTLGYFEQSRRERRKPGAWGLRWSGSLSSTLAVLLLSSQISFPWRKTTAVVGKGCSLRHRDVPSSRLPAAGSSWVQQRGAGCSPMGTAGKCL